MGFWKNITLFNRAEIFALAILLLVLCIGAGIRFYEKSSEVLPPELFFRADSIADSAAALTTPAKRSFRDLLSYFESHPLNLNSAPAESLELLPHIGPALSRRIIDHRDSSGGFDSVGQFIAVKGIGPKRLAALRKYLTVD